MHPGGCGLYGLVELSIRSDKDEMKNWERRFHPAEIGRGNARETGGGAVSGSSNKTGVENLFAHGVLHALLVSSKMLLLRLLNSS
jgi:hypothetical protein